MHLLVTLGMPEWQNAVGICSATVEMKVSKTGHDSERASFCHAELGHDLLGRKDFAEEHTNKRH